jgi:hypothetical protein
MAYLHSNILIKFCEMESLTIDDYIRSLAALQLILVAVTTIVRRIIYKALNLLTIL